MGIGQRKIINIVLPGETTGVDGIEADFTFSKQVWAEVNEVSTSNSFTGQASGTARVYEFLLDVDSAIPMGQGVIAEYVNRQYLINTIDRGDRESNKSKYGYKFIPNEEGMYWRIIGGSVSDG